MRLVFAVKETNLFVFEHFLWFKPSFIKHAKTFEAVNYILKHLEPFNDLDGRADDSFARLGDGWGQKRPVSSLHGRHVPAERVSNLYEIGIARSNTRWQTVIQRNAEGP